MDYIHRKIKNDFINNTVKRLLDLPYPIMVEQTLVRVIDKNGLEIDTIHEDVRFCELNLVVTNLDWLKIKARYLKHDNDNRLESDFEFDYDNEYIQKSDMRPKPWSSSDRPKDFLIEVFFFIYNQ